MSAPDEPGAPADGDILTLRRIGKTYPNADGSGPLRVLSGIDLALAPGELVCVAGRSGCGKTTLLNIAAALLQPTEGVVLWRDVQPAELDDRARAEMRRSLIGFAFQTGGLIPSLTATENVALPGLPSGTSGDARDRVREVLARVGLEGRERQFPSQLSAGQRQRVGIARALFAEPAALLVDEPTANLDRRTADQIIELLSGLATVGHGILVASHDPRLIGRAGRVLWLE